MSIFFLNLCLAFRVDSRKCYVWTENLGHLMLKVREKLVFKLCYVRHVAENV